MHEGAEAITQRTLKFADREKIEQLVASYFPWKRSLILSLSQDTDLCGYVSVLSAGAVPPVNPPAAYAGNNEAILKSRGIEYKIYLENKEKVPKRNARFIATLLKHCDSDLRHSIENSIQFQEFMGVIPIDVVGAFTLICEKAICEPCHKLNLRNKCEAYFRTIEMRKSNESIQRFISRFDDAHSFGVTNLGMTEVDDETQRMVFLSAISKVPALEFFWRHETMSDDPASSRAELTKRADDWVTCLRIPTDKHKVAKAFAAESPQLSLVAREASSNPSKKKGGKQRFLKKTGPKDQTHHDNRVAQNLVSSSSYQQSGGFVSQSYGQQPGRQLGNACTYQEERPRFRSPPPPQGSSYGQNRGSRDTRYTQNNSSRGSREFNNSRPRCDGRTYSGPQPSAPKGKKSFFSGPHLTDQCYQYVEVEGNEDEAMVDSDELFFDTLPDLIPSAASAGQDVTDDFTEFPGLVPFGANACLTPSVNNFCAVSREDQPYGLSPDQLRSCTALDSACTFHLVNAHVAKQLLMGGFRPTGRSFDVQALTGAPTSMPLVTSRHISGHEVRLVEDAPMSLMSLAVLSDTHDLVTTVKDVIKFTPTRLGRPSTLTFKRKGNLYLLTSITGEEGRCGPGDFFDRPVEPPHQPDLVGSSRVPDDLALMSLAVSSQLPLDNPVKSDRTLVPGPISYDHSSILEKSFVDAVSHAEPTSIFTKRQLNRAAELKHLKLSLRGISDSQLRLMLGNNRIKGCDLSPKDVDTAKSVYGNPDLKGKLTEAHQQTQLSPLEHMNPRQVCELYCDIMALTELPCFSLL